MDQNRKKLPPIGFERAERLAAMNSQNVNLSQSREHINGSTQWTRESPHIRERQDALPSAELEAWLRWQRERQFARERQQQSGPWRFTEDADDAKTRGEQKKDTAKVSTPHKKPTLPKPKPVSDQKQKLTVQLLHAQQQTRRLAQCIDQMLPALPNRQLFQQTLRQLRQLHLLLKELRRNQMMPQQPQQELSTAATVAATTAATATATAAAAAAATTTTAVHAGGAAPGPPPPPPAPAATSFVQHQRQQMQQQHQHQLLQQHMQLQSIPMPMPPPLQQHLASMQQQMHLCTALILKAPVSGCINNGLVAPPGGEFRIWYMSHKLAVNHWNLMQAENQSYFSSNSNNIFDGNSNINHICNIQNNQQQQH